MKIKNVPSSSNIDRSNRRASATWCGTGNVHPARFSDPPTCLCFHFWILFSRFFIFGNDRRILFFLFLFSKKLRRSCHVKLNRFWGRDTANSRPNKWPRIDRYKWSAFVWMENWKNWCRIETYSGLIPFLKIMTASMWFCTSFPSLSFETRTMPFLKIKFSKCLITLKHFNEIFNLCTK